MAPPQAMTGDTLLNEKTAPSPTSPTNTDTTLTGDAIIEIEEDRIPSTRPSSQPTPSSVNGGTTPPHDQKRRQYVLRRISELLKSQPEPVPITRTRTRKLENTPNGFPRLAAFQSCDTNFALYRSFNYLHSRILLDLQDEITSLEKLLDEVDEDDEFDAPNRLRSREIDVDEAIRDDSTRSRRAILHQIKTKLLEYDEVLIKARQLETFQKPSDRNYRSVRRYHYNTDPLMDSETDSIRSKEDIISLHNGRESATFDGIVEMMLGQVDRALQKVLRTSNLPLQRLFRSPELQQKTGDKYISLYSSTRIDKLVNMLITLVIFILLVIPVIILYHLTSTSAISNSSDLASNNATVPASTVDDHHRETFNAVGVLIIFTLLFSATMSLLTRAARHELFAASAAYCAILVVFIGNFTGPGN